MFKWGGINEEKVYATENGTFHTHDESRASTYDSVSMTSHSTETSLETTNRHPSNFETNLHFGDCFLWESPISTFCFCQFRCRRLSELELSRIHEFIQQSDEPYLDCVLAHLTSWISEAIQSKAGMSLMKTIISKTSAEGLNALAASGVVLDMLSDFSGCELVELMIGRGLSIACLAEQIFSESTTLWTFATGNFANYVVQDIIHKMCTSDVENSIASFTVLAQRLAIHPRGAYVLQAFLQKLLETVQHDAQCLEVLNVARLFEAMLRSLIQLGDELFLNKYGNFTAQEAISLLEFVPVVEDEFTSVLSTNFVKYACDVFGHCVIERFLLQARLCACRVLVSTVLSLESHDFLRCAEVRWGRFVVAKLWDKATESQQRLLRAKLNWVHSLRSR